MCNLCFLDPRKRGQSPSNGITPFTNSFCQKFPSTFYAHISFQNAFGQPSANPYRANPYRAIIDGNAHTTKHINHIYPRLCAGSHDGNGASVNCFCFRIKSISFLHLSICIPHNSNAFCFSASVTVLMPMAFASSMVPSNNFENSAAFKSAVCFIIQ